MIPQDLTLNATHHPPPPPRLPSPLPHPLPPLLPPHHPRLQSQVRFGTPVPHRSHALLPQAPQQPPPSPHKQLPASMAGLPRLEAMDEVVLTPISCHSQPTHLRG